ncbi:hypothetical protein PZB81_08720 [Staphylococcus epidermidis]|uniref:hypothetical protein n=1 Tax=Staphylococcus epidermidis TaxID=1282 RepID=UPI00026C0B30|nr:hypothetical protein [Staphylococcus epidermidis]EJD81191.1 hypothetical protein HMPREF9995_01485 [Staphylococcus epidermidis NIHLM095]EJD84172.1 hypothetical protein HMPREF9993_00242 [Staphylococcus epidermidis NIHLM087]MCT1658439.1 hypothetical protein [Staphylococcus epidermidis]MDH9340062.1 hypothetical protein [Staphylococcus epidermidis]MDH9362176.1 hypothetical protein [Staphylococcus epidermidis]
MDQNWYTASNTGNPPYKIRRTYSNGSRGVRYFVRPPFAPEIKKPSPQPSVNGKDKSDDNQSKDKQPSETKKTFWKDVTRIKYTTGTEEVTYPENIYHFVADGKIRKNKPKGLLIRNARTMSSVKDLYNTRLKYNREAVYPHCNNH